MEPSTALAWLQAGSSIFGKVLGGGQPAGPAVSSASGALDGRMDDSGWVVATGRAVARGELSKTDSGQGQQTPQGIGQSLLPMLAAGFLTWMALQ